ncbi:MAG: hypothetical protein GX224_00855 [Thermoplasmatales archaeon]|nr:hypothetical protein [Thermoplasmatales archaeon]
MALENVEAEIGRAAEEKVKAIMAEANAEIQRIDAEADAEIAAIREKESKREADTIGRLRRQEASSAELESKKVILAKKNEILAKTFEATLADLVAAPKADKLEQYKMMVAAATKAIGKPKAYMSDKDGFTAAQLGVSKVEKDAGIAGGLILESEDGALRVDMQYETILRQVWDRELKGLSDILLG